MLSKLPNGKCGLDIPLPQYTRRLSRVYHHHKRVIIKHEEIQKMPKVKLGPLEDRRVYRSEITQTKQL